MELRLAELNDIPEIMMLVNSVIPMMHAAGNFQWNNNYPNAAVFTNDVTLAQLWLCEDDGVIAGVAAITTEPEPEYAQAEWDPDEEAIIVHRLAVSITHRGKGIAGLLMNKAETIAAERSINVLRVDTSSVNLVMQNIFRQLGYVFAGKISLYSRPGQTFFCYEKRLD